MLLLIKSVHETGCELFIGPITDELKNRIEGESKLQVSQLIRDIPVNYRIYSCTTRPCV